MSKTRLTLHTFQFSRYDPGPEWEVFQFLPLFGSHESGCRSKDKGAFSDWQANPPISVHITYCGNMANQQPFLVHDAETFRPTIHKFLRYADTQRKHDVVTARQVDTAQREYTIGGIM